MAKKKCGLGSLIDKMPDDTKTRGIVRWDERLKKNSPALYAEVIDLIDRYNGGEEALARKFYSGKRLASWLVPHVKQAGLTVHEATIAKTISERGATDNGKKTR